jgi:hypothetical protein
MQLAFSPEHSRKRPAPEAGADALGTGSGRGTVLAVFLALALVSFLLRIFYSTHLYQDDGLWFTAAEEILRGKTLYREIYFDKPPAIALLYAGLFKIFGPHILTIRLFTILYSLMISAVIYLFGSWLYRRREGLVAAAMFTVFSTTYSAGHVQGLNTDFLMALPYTSGAYLLVRSRGDLFGKKLTRARSAMFAIAGGAVVGVASQVNPKAMFDLVFFALFLFFARRWRRAVEDQEATATTGHDSEGNALFLDCLPLTTFYSVSFSIAGFIAGALPFLIYIAATRALESYWRYVWQWGSLYAGYYQPWWILLTGFEQTADYFLLNNTLLIALIYVAVTSARRIRGVGRGDAKQAPEAGFASRAMLRADLTLLLWLAVSYAGMAIGGRFFGHYFFEIIPCLCLIGARGVIAIASPSGPVKQAIGGATETGSSGRSTPLAFSRARRIVFLLVFIGFVFTLVRFHGRTVMLAADWARGAKSAESADWLHERLNREERRVAAQVRDIDGAPGVADELGAEEIRAQSPRGAQGASDYLFVWGYRPEIYYWSGLLPSSKYLSTQPLTGVPADVHYFGDEYHSLLDEGVMAAERMELVRELQQTRPEFIIDELGTFNARLSIKSYAELREFMDSYKSLGMVERFEIYRRKDFTKGYRKRNPDAQP